MDALGQTDRREKLGQTFRYTSPLSNLTQRDQIPS